MLQLKVEEVIFKIEYLLEGTNHKIVITDNVDGTDVVNEIFRTLNGRYLGSEPICVDIYLIN